MFFLICGEHALMRGYLLKFFSVFFVLLIFGRASGISSVTNENYSKGLSYYSQKKFLLAIGSFKKAIDDGYQDPKMNFLLGNSYVNNEDYDKALEQYKISSGLADNAVFQSIITHNMGYVYFLKKDYKTAIDYFNKSYLENSNLVQTFWYKGMAYYKMRDKTNTINEWENYLDKAPNGQESDNIRRALAILKSGTFDFDKNKIFIPGDQTQVSNKTPNVEPLIDIQGVLEDVKPVDKGKAPDTQVEEIEH